MSQNDVTLVTYSGIPDLTPDDQQLAAELTRRGLHVRAAVWSDGDVDWSQSTMTVLRSTWDYFYHPTEFLAWLAAVEAQTQVINTPSIIRWNHDKHYLEDLHARGIQIVPSYFLDGASDDALSHVVELFDTADLVIKPAIGGAAWRARRFALDRERDEALAHLQEIVQSGSALIQPFLRSVLKERERSLVYFDGGFSHAYLKAPFSGGAGGTEEIPHPPTPAEFDLATAVLNGLDRQPAYARVDMALLDHHPHLMELELIEPALHFHVAAGSEARMADVLERRLAERSVAPSGRPGA